MTRETLNGLTCKELRNIAKDYNIVGRWDMTKPQLIEAILDVENAKVSVENSNVVKNDNITINNSNGMKLAENDANKMRYVRDVNIGVIVAFKDGDKVRSAKVVRKSTNRNILKLEDRRGREFLVSYNDVIWVRTGHRWPRGVYELLTGGRKYDKAKTSIK